MPEAVALTADELRLLAELSDVLRDLGVTEGSLVDQGGNRITVTDASGRLYIRVEFQNGSPSSLPSGLAEGER